MAKIGKKWLHRGMYFEFSKGSPDLRCHSNGGSGGGGRNLLEVGRTDELLSESIDSRQRTDQRRNDMLSESLLNKKNLTFAANLKSWKTITN